MKSQLIGKDPDAGKDWRQEEKGEIENVRLYVITDSMNMNLSKLWEIWRTGNPGVLFIRSQRVEHNLATEKQQMSYLEKCLLGLLPAFWLGGLFFWYWVAWATCIFWKLILCNLFHLLLFSLILRIFFFHLLYSFLCHAKTLESVWRKGNPLSLLMGM